MAIDVKVIICTGIPQFLTLIQGREIKKLKLANRGH
jgi:hypothetical protein